MPRIKLVSANISNYFETNKIEKRDSIPVSGNYTKGDLIINTGSNSYTNPMWICTETGTPGKWAPVTSGNSYIHPDTHPATMIVEDSTHRFVTDEEKTKWNTKASTDVATTSTNGLMSKEDKVKVNGIGDKTQLQTTNKDNLVSAINEVFQSGVNAKQGLVEALTSKNVEASTSESWESLNNKVKGIAGKKWAEGRGMSSSENRTFNFPAGGGEHMKYCEISKTNLTFEPSMISVRSVEPVNHGGGIPVSIYDLRDNTIRCVIFLVSGMGSYASYTFKIDTQTNTESSFYIPFMDINAKTEFMWVAYE